MEEEKVKVVLEYLTSKLIKDIQKFLGLINYSKRFVKEFAKIARLLDELTKKQKWRIKQEKLFETLKKRFIMEPILVALDLNRKMRMEVDMLDYAMRGVLLMECNDGQWRPVVYLSISLNEITRYMTRRYWQ